MLIALALGACNSTADPAGAVPVDWQSLEFTCTHEQPLPFDPEADGWYRTACNLQKKDEDACASEIVVLCRQAIDKNHYNAMHRPGLMYIQGVGVAPDERATVLGRVADRLSGKNRRHEHL
ncbi:hypothetical protein [Denitromonas iodatirespirans]|uniref:Uncharacterized protein n=1 Tax=Denitromonas iodatirespirans TaxID=2795389 RepID=A0A944HA41_DENI1|nr:hypothetical protein [Denitromonas iodatirespirans]MBT0963894.1 hypothetical protein [Denitromonas iodatirespirans]